MKRKGNLWTKIIDKSNLYLAYELLKNKISKDKALSVVASLSGWLRWANSYNLRMFLELESLKKELGGNS